MRVDFRCVGDIQILSLRSAAELGGHFKRPRRHVWRGSMHKFFIVAGVSAALALTGSQARGSNLAVESFNYPTGTLQGDNGGVGF